MAQAAHTATETMVDLTIKDLAQFTEAVDTIISAHRTASAIPDNTLTLIQVFQFAILIQTPLTRGSSGKHNQKPQSQTQKKKLSQNETKYIPFHI